MYKNFTVIIFLFLTLNIKAQNLFSDCGVVADIDGNQYSTIILGNDCWMRENLRTTHYADGTAIYPTPADPKSQITPSSIDIEIIVDGKIVDKYHPTDKLGFLYTWHSVLNGAEPTEETDGRIQGVCPNGWHVPSNFEWMNLEDFVGYRNEFRCGPDVNFIAKSLAANYLWKDESAEQVSECAIIADITTNNATTFEIYPAGSFWIDSFDAFGREAGFWTCSNGSEDTSPIHFFNATSAQVEINCTPKEAFYSVRCVKNKN